MSGVDACRFCGDPLNCDDSCEVDRVRQEEARVWLARCRASLLGATLADKLVSSREREEQ